MSSFEDSFGSDHLFLVVFIVWEKLRQSGWRLDKSVLSALPRVLLGSHTHTWGEVDRTFKHLAALNIAQRETLLNIAQHLNIAQNRSLKNEDIYVNLTQQV